MNRSCPSEVCLVSPDLLGKLATGMNANSRTILHARGHQVHPLPIPSTMIYSHKSTSHVQPKSCIVSLANCRAAPARRPSKRMPFNNPTQAIQSVSTHEPQSTEGKMRMRASHSWHQLCDRATSTLAAVSLFAAN